MNETCPGLKETSPSIAQRFMINCAFIYFFSYFSFTIKVGIRPEGIKELFGTDIPGFTGGLGFNDLQALLKVVRCSLMFNKECDSYKMCFMTSIEKRVIVQCVSTTVRRARWAMYQTGPTVFFRSKAGRSYQVISLY